MSKALRLLAASVLAVVAQTTLVQYMRIAGTVPDLMTALLIAVTSYCGPYGGYCVGAVMALLYDASVGYVLAINLVTYALIGVIAPLMRQFFNRKLRRLKHKSYFEMMLIAFLLTVGRETVNIGYLFIIGSEQGLWTLLRVLLCAGYTAVMTLPVAFLLNRLMHWHPRIGRRRSDFDDDATGGRIDR